jgi:hypothetical protein
MRASKRRGIMQLKLGIEGMQKSMARYSVSAFCNKCGGMHDMGLSIMLSDGPGKRQSLCDAYKNKNIPQTLANLPNVSVTCPATGRGFTQKDEHQIFLVPAEK